ncbi:VWA domain-containing protein [bacterium]|nr:VWA domain-containing protein [candidate division CSSED10-310 bacterium]
MWFIFKFSVILTAGMLLFGCLKDPVAPEEGFSDPDDTATGLNVYILGIQEADEKLEITVSVTDESGDPIENLRMENFAVTLASNMTSGWVEIEYMDEQQDLPISAAMTMDYSGSMAYQSLIDMEGAVIIFINLMGDIDRGEIIKFSSYVEVMQYFTTDKVALKNAARRSFSGAGHSTALNDSIYQGLTDALSQPGQRAVIALTDGGENASSKSKSDVINLARNNVIPIFTIGLYGSGLDVDYLRELADETNGRYYYAPSSADLANIYVSISNVLSGLYKIYCKGFVTTGDEIIVMVHYNGMTGYDSGTMTFGFSSSGSQGDHRGHDYISGNTLRNNRQIRQKQHESVTSPLKR